VQLDSLTSPLVLLAGGLGLFVACTGVALFGLFRRRPRAARNGRRRLAHRRWAVPGALGMVLAVLGAAGLGEADGASPLDIAYPLARLFEYGPVVADCPRAASTDRGTPVRVQTAVAPRPPAQLNLVEEQILQDLGRAARLIRQRPADDGSNC